MNKEIAIIGSGFSSLSAACHLAKSGYKVSVFEKNSTVGGRCRQFVKDGFTFDMGPSWYWMPDIFDKFFAEFGKSCQKVFLLCDSPRKTTPTRSHDIPKWFRTGGWQPSEMNSVFCRWLQLSEQRPTRFEA